MKFPSPKRILAGVLGALLVGRIATSAFPLTELTFDRATADARAVQVMLGVAAGLAGWYAGQWVLDLIEARKR